MALIDIKKLNAELDKLIDKQKVEIKEIDAKIDADNEAKWNAFLSDLQEFQSVVDEIKCDITLPFSVIHGREYMFNFTVWSSILVGWDKNRCIACRIRNLTYKGWKGEDIDYYYRLFMNEWPKVKDDFTRRFEEECVKALKKKAEKANEEYEAKLREERKLQCE